MMDRPELEVEALENAEGALNLGQALVGAHGLGGIKPRRRQRSAQHIDAVERSIPRDTRVIALIGQTLGGNLPVKILAHLLGTEQLADAVVDALGVAQGTLWPT